MPRDPRKQQKSKERRNQREKEKKAKSKLSNQNPMGLLAKAASAPFLHCAIDKDAFTEGIGTMCVVRQLPSGLTIAALFLVDMYCLGIKDAFIETGTQFQIDRLVQKVHRGRLPAVLSPADAKKMITEAAAYAAQFGLNPCEDYARILGIFKGVDASDGRLVFEFGKDGRPLYISGPNDTTAFQTRVLASLNRTAGPDGFVFLSGEKANEAGRWSEYDDDDYDEDDSDLAGLFPPFDRGIAPA